jgi:hypothetical protein
MVEGNSYISKFVILFLDWKKNHHLYIREGLFCGSRWHTSKHRMASRLDLLLYNCFEKLELEVIKKKQKWPTLVRSFPLLNSRHKSLLFSRYDIHTYEMNSGNWIHFKGLCIGTHVVVHLFYSLQRIFTLSNCHNTLINLRLTSRE